MDAVSGTRIHSADEGRARGAIDTCRTPIARPADELYARWEEIRAELAETGDRSIGTLRLCGFSTAAATLVPYVVSPLRAVDPHCTTRIVEADPLECFELSCRDATIDGRSPIRPRAVAGRSARIVGPCRPPAGDPAIGTATRGRRCILDPPRSSRSLLTPSGANRLRGSRFHTRHCTRGQRMGNWRRVGWRRPGGRAGAAPGAAGAGTPGRASAVTRRTRTCQGILASVRRGSRNQYAIAAGLTALEEIFSRHR